MRTLAIANQKGGVAKTTTAVALAHDLAQREYTVVLVDLDAQGNAATCLGLKPQPALFQVATGVLSLQDALVKARPNLWFLASDTSTAKLKNMWAGEMYRETVLARMLDSLTADFVILDTAPGRDIMHDNAHHAANEVVIPVAVDHLALVGVTQEFETLRMIRDHGHTIEVTAILPTFFDKVTIESTVNLTELAQRFGDLVLPAVPQTVRLREAPAYGKTVWEHLNNNHEACKAYRRLTERVLHER